MSGYRCLLMSVNPSPPPAATRSLPTVAGDSLAREVAVTSSPSGVSAETSACLSCEPCEPCEHPTGSCEGTEHWLLEGAGFPPDEVERIGSLSASSCSSSFSESGSNFLSTSQISPISSGSSIPRTSSVRASFPSSTGVWSKSSSQVSQVIFSCKASASSNKSISARRLGLPHLHWISTSIDISSVSKAFHSDFEHDLQAQVDANDWEVEPHLWKANETKTENHELIMGFWCFRNGIIA